MRHGKSLRWVGLLSVVFIFVIFGAQIGKGQLKKLKKMGAVKVEKAKLTVADVEPKLAILAGTNLDPFSKTAVEYCANTGLSNYDEFFKKAAVTYGSLPVAQSMVTDAQKNLKAFAQDHAASEEAKKQLAEIDADKEWTEEELNVVKEGTLKFKKESTKSEAEKFAKMSANMAIAYAALGISIKNAGELIKQGTKMSKSVKSDFSGTNALKAPAITKGLKDSVDKLKLIPTEGKKTYATMAKLMQIIKEYIKESK